MWFLWKCIIRSVLMKKTKISLGSSKNIKVDPFFSYKGHSTLLALQWMSHIKIFFPYIIISLIVLPLLLLEKGEMVLLINANRDAFYDRCFIFFSSLGNGFAILAIFLFVLSRRLKWIGIFLVSFSVQLFLVLLFKKGLYAGELRPFLYFSRMGAIEQINLVEGVKIRYVNTFPSGHTATIFMLSAFLSSLFRSYAIQLGLMVISIFVGISRIYLVQHFFVDVYFGMLIGWVSVLFSIYLIEKNPRHWHSKKITRAKGKFILAE